MKKIKEEVIQKFQFKAELSVYNAFGPEHWKVLISQMENDGDYTNQLFFGQSRVSQNWRADTLVKARAKLGIGIIRANVGGRVLRETSGTSAHSATEAAKRVTFTHTLCISDDVAANDAAVSQVVSTLEAFRGGVTPIIPFVVTSYFAVGNQSKARNLVIDDYDSAMMIIETSYDYETAKKLAAELKDLSKICPRIFRLSRKTATKIPLNSPAQMRSIGCACFPGMICMPRFGPSWTRIAPI